MNRLRVALLSLFVCGFVSAQTTVPSVVPITKEPSHHLVLENEYVRVFKVEVAPHSETLYHQHDVDYVFVTLGDSDVDSVRIGEKPVRLHLKDGDTRFTKGGFAHKAVNNSDKPFVNVTVELKKPSETALQPCCEGQALQLRGSQARYVFDNHLVRIIEFTKKPGFSMSLDGMPHVPHSSGMLVVLNFMGIVSDPGGEIGKGPGCPCPTKNVRPGEIMWIKNDDRYRFASGDATRGLAEPRSTQLFAIEIY